MAGVAPVKLDENVCPKCGAPLGVLEETPNGRKLQRCSKGSWDKEARKTVGCNFVKWLAVEPQTLDEKCPKCGAPVVLQVTRFGKKMKKCSKGGWDPQTKKATGCEYIEWQNGTREVLDEKCPECGEPLVLATTSTGKRMRKCSTAGWDREKRQATGCPYIEWLRN
jgi:ssDNA-binding Zn-finger/Zn-ribbon topoisomerase 1